MKLNDITIKNYRSISELPIAIEEIAGKNCLILLGINEAGKSNILKAISLADTVEKIDYKIDCNKQAQDINESILVVYDLKAENDEIGELLVKTKLSNEFIEKIKVKKIERKIEFASDSTEKLDYYHIYIEDVKDFSNFIFDKTTKEVKKIIDVYQGEEQITKENIKTLVGENFDLLDKEIVEGFLEDVADDYFEDIRPEIIFWKSSEKYLMNEFVNLNEFKEDLTKSIPLRNIFRLSGINDEQVKNRIDLIVADEDKRAELEEVLTENVTKYINKIWKEHKINIKVRIEENLFCKVKVEDKENTKPKYRMDQRSDGFKQFVSILLNLSAENDTDVLKNKIILLDEPEVHLHPSGIKYLRDELLKISNNNVVLIATHSIFMVDKKNIERHCSVWKDENSITQLEKIDKDNPLQEEVIYESLGTSIYEMIKENVIVFEGKSDKDYFDFFTKKFNKELDPLNFYSIAATGVEKIPNYIKFLKDSLVKGYAVVDSDQEGKNIKKQIIDSEKEFENKVFEINDIKDLSFKATLEDLLPSEKLMNYFKQKYEFEFTPDEKKPIIEQMKKTLQTNKKYINDDEFKKFKLEMHQSIMKDLSKKTSTKDNIETLYSKYFDFISSLHNKLKSS